MKFADCFFIFMLFVFTLLLILAGVLSFPWQSFTPCCVRNICRGWTMYRCLCWLLLVGKNKEHHRWENARRRAADPLIKILRMNSRWYDQIQGRNPFFLPSPRYPTGCVRCSNDTLLEIPTICRYHLRYPWLGGKGRIRLCTQPGSTFCICHRLVPIQSHAE